MRLTFLLLRCDYYCHYHPRESQAKEKHAGYAERVVYRLRLYFFSLGPGTFYGIRLGFFRQDYRIASRTYCAWAGQDFQFRAGTGFELNGTTLQQPIFAIEPPASIDYKPFAPALDFALHGQSGAIDKGVLLPNINDDFLGNAPDLGASELGGATLVYGVRNLDTVPPVPPTGLTVQ